jgi:hypothetical protein
VKLPARVSAPFGSLGTHRNESGRAVTPAVSSDAEGSGALRRGHTLIGRLALSILGAVCALSLVFGASFASAAAPTLVMGTATNPTYTSVDVTGELNAGGGETFWGFRVSSDGGLTWEGVGGTNVNGESSGTGPEMLNGTIEGLRAGVTYKVRLGAVQAPAFEPEFVSSEPSPEFTTEAVNAPSVAIDPVSALTASTVHLSGHITPNPVAGDPTASDVHWHFECTPECPGSFEEQTVAAGAGETGVSFDAHELQPATAYEVTLVGRNAGGPVSAGPVSFNTETLPPPIVTIEPVTTFTDTTAHFVGHIDPNKPAGGEPAASDVSWHFQCTPACPGSSENVEVLPAEAGSTEVHVDASGLEPNTHYEVALIASNRGGPVTAGPTSFSTEEILPSVSVGPGASVGTGNYRLEGTVNPHNSPITRCVFEYGPTSTYGQTASCEPIPAAVNKPEFVTASISGLTLDATYHFRLAVTNARGPVQTSDATFEAHPPCPNEAIREEQASTFLPECRAWELASNPYTEGFGTTVLGISPDGSRMYYRTNGNFNENGNGTACNLGCNGYLAARDAVGWTSEPLAPSGVNYRASGFPILQSSDLTSSLWEMARSDQPLEDLDFYLRSADGSFTRIGPTADPAKLPPSAPGGRGSPPGGQEIVAASDFSRFAFTLPGEYSYRYTGFTPASLNLYEYGPGDTEPALVPVDNNGVPINVGCESLGGANPAKNHAMSDDGRVLFWTSRCQQEQKAEIFARIGQTTIGVSASHCDRGPSEQCLNSHVAQFIAASSDGSVAYFLTSDQLVDGDTDGSPDLYACHIPPGIPSPSGAMNQCASLVEVSGGTPGADVEGVVRVSDDGSRAYFVAHGVLAANAGANGETAEIGENNLYLWEAGAGQPGGGTTKFVARLQGSDSSLWTQLLLTEQQTTESGRYLLLNAHTPLIDSGPEADTDGGALDVYRYDADTGQFMRLSSDTSGSGGNEPNAETKIAYIASTGGEQPNAYHPAMSDDGQTVAFSTSEALSPFDHNDDTDAYVWHEGRVALITGGSTMNGRGITEPPMVSSDGQNIFTTNEEALTPNHANTTLNSYDVRVDGGFAFPGSNPCMGEACRPPASGPSTPTGPATQQAGAGNPPPPRSCPKGKVRRKGHCVKVHRSKRPNKKHRQHKHRHHTKHVRNAHREIGHK